MGTIMIDGLKLLRLQVAAVNDALEGLKECHSDSLTFLRELATKIKAEELSLEESVDIGFLLRECETQLDEMRKDFKAHKEAIGEQTCYRLSLQDKMKCKGELATGSVKATHFSRLPHPEREPEKFAKLAEFFGMNIKDVPLGSVRFHWPTVKKYITHCMEEGVELPPELSDADVELAMTYRRKV